MHTLSILTGGVLGATDSIRNQLTLQAEHRVQHPILALGAQLVSFLPELLAVAESVSDWVARGSAVVSRLDADGVETAVVPLGIGAYGWDCAVV